jgi:hypothetical protein
VVDDAGQAFMGHGVYGYDLAKNKYVSTWVDSMGSFVVNAEGAADATGKVISYEMNEPRSGHGQVRQDAPGSASGRMARGPRMLGT